MHGSRGQYVSSRCRPRPVQFLEMEARVSRVGLEEAIRARGSPLNIRRQIREQTPELPGRPRLDQSSSSNGRVSPLASSSGASRAMRRIISRFSTKRLFQASSSARAARICDAIASCSSRGRTPTFSSAFPTTSTCLKLTNELRNGRCGLLSRFAGKHCV